MDILTVDGLIETDSTHLHPRLSMNMDEFNECMDSSKYKNRVKANYDEAVRNGVQSTPTFILISQDGIKLEIFAGAQPYSVFAATIESML